MILRKHQPFYKRPPILFAAGLLVVALAVLGGVMLLSGNSGGTDDVSTVVKEKTPTQSESGTAGGPDAISTMTPTSAAIALEELPANYEVDIPNTFAMTVSTFSSSYWFKSDTEGQDLAKQWRIIDGYQVYYQPKGLAAEALTGAAYVRVELYKFVDPEGAGQAWGHLQGLMHRTTGSEAVEANPLANDWAAYRVLEGTVGTSDTLAVFHRYNFRRGNYVVSVQTWGADPHMNIDPARNIAATIDDKLLGARPAVEPTPIPTPSFPGLGN